MFINSGNGINVVTFVQQVALGLYLSRRLHVLQGEDLQVLVCVLNVSSSLSPLIHVLFGVLWPR